MRRIAVLLALAACDDTDAATCETTQDEVVDCQPLYTPSFDALHERTLRPTCALSSCHDAEGAKGGLVYETADEAYDALTASGLVVPGDPGCSTAMHLLDTDDAGTMMPPGRQLSEAERCVVRIWIAEGAPRY